MHLFAHDTHTHTHTYTLTRTHANIHAHAHAHAHTNTCAPAQGLRILQGPTVHAFSKIDAPNWAKNSVLNVKLQELSSNSVM